MGDKNDFGATGQFPQGKLRSNDKGELRIGITHFDGKVVIDFGDTAVEWVGFDPAAGRALAAVICEHCKAIENGEPTAYER